MIVEVHRLWMTPRSTIGEMLIDGRFFCYTLEDVARPAGSPKVPGKTAIPIGSYRLVIDHSVRFGKMMPHVLNVPGFQGIRIHAGNAAADTEGCILLGMIRMIDQIGRSRVAFLDFMARLEAAGEARLEIS